MMLPTGESWKSLDPASRTREAPSTSIALPLHGRFQRSDGSEHACRLDRFELTFSARVIPAAGERIVAFVDRIGGIEGTVVDVTETSFSLAVEPDRSSERFLAKLASLARAQLGSATTC